MKIWLSVKYEEKAAAKKAGAKWDLDHRRWYIDSDQDVSRFFRWLPENMQPRSFEKRLMEAKKKFKGKKDAIRQ